MKQSTSTHIEEEFMMEDVGMYFSYNSNEKSDIIMIENVEELKRPNVIRKI